MCRRSEYEKIILNVKEKFPFCLFYTFTLERKSDDAKQKSGIAS